MTLPVLIDEEASSAPRMDESSEMTPKRLTAIVGPAQYWHEYLMAQTALIISVLALLALVIVPLKLFLFVAVHFGRIDQDVLILSPTGRVLLYELIGFTILLSITTGAIAKALFARFPPNAVILMVGACGVYWGATSIGVGLRDATAAMSGLQKGDNVKAGLFVGFWLLMFGFAAKAFWDEGRDRVAALLTSRVSLLKKHKTESR